MFAYNKVLFLIKALSTSTIDSSDYILLATAIIKNILKKDLKSELNNIQTLYLNNEKDKAIAAIKQICIENSAIKNNIQLFELLSKTEALADDPLKDQSRRYFETIFSTALWNSIGEAEFKSLELLSSVITDFNKADITSKTRWNEGHKESPKGIIAFSPPKEIKSLADAKEVMSIIRDVGDDTEEIVTIKHGLFTDSYMRKDRAKTAKEGTSFSMNPGILKSSDPVPFDERTPAVQNRIVDKYTIDKTVAREKGYRIGYSEGRPDVPFVNSASGTVVTLVVLLNKLVEENKDKIDRYVLQFHLNNIVRSFLAYYCNEGFHSLAEMMDILKEERIQKIFIDNGLLMKMAFPDAITSQVFAASEDYARTLCLRRALAEEVVKSAPTKKSPPAPASF